MSGFTPLNPEDRIEDGTIEVDETREIQIEDALKLYQNALKLHSQGPQFHEQTARAYSDLFASEVFRYPDAISQFKHDELSTGLEEEDSAAVPNETILEPTITADGEPSSLPQILHLAYKNRGQFALDTVKSSFIDQASDQIEARSLDLARASRIAIADFAEALDRDDTDIDLWRKAARISDVLSSKRLARFCLESVFVGDDGTISEDADLLGLDEAHAIGDLRQVLLALRDDLSTAQFPDVRAKDALLTAMKKRLDPYPHMPSRLSEIDYTDPRQRPLGFQPLQHILRPSNRSWLAVGTAIYQALLSHDQLAFDLGPGAALAIELPGEPDSTPNRELEFTTAPTTQNSTSSIAEQDPQSSLPQNNLSARNGHEPESLEQNEGRESASIDEQAAAQLMDQIAVSPIEDTKPIISEEKDDKNAMDVQSLTLLTRKRSSTSAGNDDAGRAKSKRLRAREANADANAQEEDLANNLAQHYEDQHEELAQADRWMFSTASELLAKCDVEELSTLDDLKQLIAESDRPATTSRDPFSLAMVDLRDSLSSWKEEYGHAMLSGHGAFNIDGKFPDTQSAGLAMFLEHSRPNARKATIEFAFPEGQGLERFTKEINSTWTYGHDATLLFIEGLLFTSVSKGTRDTYRGATLFGKSVTSYLITLWPPSLKQLVVQLIVKEDEYVYESLQGRLRDLEGRLLASSETAKDTWTENDIKLVEMVQTLFELHLDVYCLITHPNSEVDSNTRVLQRDRLGRWGDLASELLTRYSKILGDSDLSNSLVLRFMWASTTHATKAEDIDKDHVILCLQELRKLIQEAGDPVIYLQNNAAMPEVSASAVEQEISRLSTLEFFTDIFSNDSKDAHAVINSLEPVLDPNLDPLGSQGNMVEAQDAGATQKTADERIAQMAKLRTFLEQGDASLKLYLWKRLEEAYSQIGHKPMVVSCHLRSVETIMEELQAKMHYEKPSNERQIALLSWLVTIDKLMIQLLKVVLNEADAFDHIYYEHLQSSMSAVARLSRLLHSFALLDDSFRIGDISLPQTKASGARLFEKTRDKLREMQIRVWLLQYALIKEGMAQNKALYNTPFDDRARYLRFVHNALGARGYCKYSNKLLLKVLKADLLNMPTEDDYEADISQVLFDLHHLKLVTGAGDANHDCPTESLDKATALKIVPLVMTQANRMNIRDLIKSDLKATIDKVQLVIGLPKSSPALLHNRRLISAYLKSALNLRDLHRSTQGIGDLPTKPVQSENEVIASQGWYYLQGYMALTKFKSVKRVSPTPTVDLDIAAAFFKQDLEHGVEKWETWYRFAQAYEANIEDDILWTADKLNNNRAELAALQRNAIHCYSMALAIAIRTIDDLPESMGMISDMLTEFATLVYTASREPLSMDAFSLESFERHYSNDTTQQMYRAPPFPPTQPYSAWNFSSYLLRQAIASRPRRWINHYLLGKCLWKMYTQPMKTNLKRVPSVEQILDAFVEAINTLPERRDNRAEPVLEPHFKIVSIVHKLVHGGRLSPTQGSKILKATSYAQKEHLSLDDEDGEGEGWDAYIRKILHNLEKADKSNWHHRIIARTAHILYDDDPSNPVAALTARHQFTQQIFTKTMTLQVWKPENERPGRHFVYTSRYVLFFIKLLDQLNDRTSLDALARRIRRKQGDFLNHAKIWEEVCKKYVQVLRRAGKLPEGYMDTIFKPIHYDTFGRVSEGLEKWAHDSETHELKVEILRDALELKKLNNNLMKGTMFEDLVTDAYASVYEVFAQSQASQLQGPDRPSATPPIHTATPKLRGGSAEPPSGGEADGQSEQLTGTKLPVRSTQLAGAQIDGTSTDTAMATATDQTMPPAWLQRQASPGPYGNPPFHVHTLGQASMTIGPPKPHLGRPKQITRREIQRKAEAVLSKPPPIPTPKLLTAPGLPGSKGRIAVDPPSPSLRRDRALGADQSVAATSQEDEESKQTAVDEGDRKDKEAPSRRSSVGDQWDQATNADNETGSGSELSDIDAEEMQDEEAAVENQRSDKPSARLMFPNLVKANVVDSSTVDSEDVSMADGGDEGDGEGPIEGDVEGEGDEGEDGLEMDQVDVQDEDEDADVSGTNDQETDSRPADEDSQRIPGAWIAL